MPEGLSKTPMQLTCGCAWGFALYLSQTFGRDNRSKEMSKEFTHNPFPAAKAAKNIYRVL